MKWSNMAYLIFLPIALLHFQPSFAQDQQKEEQVSLKSLIDSRHFVFLPRMASPQRGRSIQLTGDNYELKIMGDTLVSYLPYYGRSYVGVINPSEAGLDFTSKDFDYNVKERKKGGWEIQIKPKDVREPRQISITITGEGSTSVFVSGNNRDNISFNGTVTGLTQ